MNKPWRKLLSREGVDATTMSGADVFLVDSIQKFTGSKREQFFTYFQGKYFTHYINADGYAVGRFLYKKYLASPAQVKKYYREGKKLWSRVKRQTTFWRKQLRNDSPDYHAAFEEFRREFMKISRVYNIIPYLSIEAWQYDWQEMLLKMLNRNHVSEKEREKIFNSVYQPWKKTALIKIQEDLKKGTAPEELVRRYQFLRSWSVVWYRPIDKNWIQGMQTKVARARFRRKSRRQIYALLKPNSRERPYLSLAPYVIFFKDWRDDLRRYQVYAWTFLWELLAKKFGCKPFDWGFLTLDEIESCIKNNLLPRAAIKRRQTHPYILTATEKLKIKTFDRRLPKKYLAIVEKLEHSRSGPNLHGVVAQKGMAKGEVIIIKSHHDIKRVTDRHILVANTTHPNYLPAMQKARAFVTNEGGLICHAAIVARELKKPCVVGTKIATKVFKDGDMVEVDAEQGIVKKV